MLKRAWLGAVAAAACAGCNWFVPLAFLGEPTEKVRPEYDKLAGHKTAVVVWASMDTLFDYPHVRLEIGTFIADKIASRLEGAEFVDSRKVEDYVQRTVEASFDPRAVGEHFGADRVIYVELLEFQIRDPTAPDFLRGRIEASATVYDLRADPDEPLRYELAPITTVYPEDHAVIFDPARSMEVRHGTYTKFAEMVAQKFYQHEQPM